jgi:hypothetical protein
VVIAAAVVAALPAGAQIRADFAEDPAIEDGRVPDTLYRPPTWTREGNAVGVMFVPRAFGEGDGPNMHAEWRKAWGHGYERGEDRSLFGGKCFRHQKNAAEDPSERTFTFPGEKTYRAMPDLEPYMELELTVVPGGNVRMVWRYQLVDGVYVLKEHAEADSAQTMAAD